jgi:hypothetical protein
METGYDAGTATPGTRAREAHWVTGNELLDKARQLVHEGNVRRIIIKNEDGRTIIEAPLTVGVVGAMLLPLWAAIGAVAALVANCSIEVERETEEANAEPESEGKGAGSDAYELC